ncbi:MAG: divalent metal cation transporter [Acidobacteriota bacterium]
MSKLFSILIGGVIAAAFLGPGTITAAASAGAGHGFSLLWALGFATLACLVLQEAAARLTIASGLPLGAALRRRSQGVAGQAMLLLVLGAIVLGCAAYEAGNILGGVAGAQLVFKDASPRLLTALSVGLALALLSLGSTRLVASVLGALVAVMGIAFAVTAIGLGPPPLSLAKGLLVPSAPAGSGLLILGLVGTTVVPYNLFLGSGLAAGRRLDSVRLGLVVAIGLGGLVSMAVLVTGSAVRGAFSFAALAEVLAAEMGPWAVDFFGAALFAAGFSSAVTAPLAAAMTARGLFADGADDPRWSDRAWRFRAVWLVVLATGAAFGLSGVRPVPVILAAQALNGALLPLVAAFLLIVVNDRHLMGSRRNTNGPAANAAMATVVAIATALGVRGVLRAASSALGRPEWAASASLLAACTALALALCAGFILRELRRERRMAAAAATAASDD